MQHATRRPSQAAQPWRQIARRIVECLDVQPGEVVQVRDHSAHWELLIEVLLAIELAGATPLPELTPAQYVERLLAEASPAYLEGWDHHRQSWTRQIDRVISLTGVPLSDAPAPALAAWLGAIHRLTRLEEERELPCLVVAVPTEAQARRLGLALAALEENLIPALSASVEDLRQETDRALRAVAGGRSLTIRSGERYELHMALGDRVWLADDGHIDAQDCLRGATTSNLPAGAIYVPVLETATEGELWLAEAIMAQDVVLRFAGGRIAQIAAVRGAEELGQWLDGHSGEPRRISHCGVGLNPYLTRPIGWTLVDEHVHGCLLLALGENRYMGGQNSSSLNVDFAIFGGSLLVDGRTVVLGGRLEAA